MKFTKKTVTKKFDDMLKKKTEEKFRIEKDILSATYKQDADLLRDLELSLEKVKSEISGIIDIALSIGVF